MAEPQSPASWDEFVSQSSSPPGPVSWDEFMAIPPDEIGPTMRGLKIGGGQFIPTLKGAVGLIGATAEKVLGEGGVSTAVKNWGLTGFQQGMEKLQPLQHENDDVTVAFGKAQEGDVGALVDFVKYAFGYGAAQVLQTAAMGVAGAVVGGLASGGAGAVPTAAASMVEKTAAQGIIKGLVEKEIAKRVEVAVAAEVATNPAITEAQKAAIRATVTPLATKSLARDIGAVTSLSVMNLAQEAGQIYPAGVEQAQKEGRELTGSDIARMWGAATVAGASETIPDVIGLGALTGRFRGLTNKLGTTRAGRAATGAAAGGALEAGQEGFQTVVEHYGAGQPLADEAGMKDIINSMAMALVPGVAVGGGVGFISRRPAVAPPPAAPTTGEIIAAVTDPTIGIDESIRRTAAAVETPQPAGLIAGGQSDINAALQRAAIAVEPNAMQAAAQAAILKKEQQDAESLRSNAGQIRPGSQEEQLGVQPGPDQGGADLQRPPQAGAAPSDGGPDQLAPGVIAPLAPKTVAGIDVDGHTDEQLQALAANPETPAITRHAAATALQARTAVQREAIQAPVAAAPIVPQAPQPAQAPAIPPAAVAPQGAPVAPAPAQPVASIQTAFRPLVESLIKRRSAASQIGRERAFNKALEAGKRILAGGKFSSADAFTVWSKAMAEDPVSAQILRDMAKAVRAPMPVAPVAAPQQPAAQPKAEIAKPAERAPEAQPAPEELAAYDTLKQAKRAAKLGDIPQRVIPHPTEKGKWAIVEAPKRERSPAQKANDARLAAARNNVDTHRDSLFAAIGKLGGMSRDAVASEWGIDPEETPRSGVVGKPVLRATGGMSVDGMAEALGEFGYLPLDENGKVDLHDFEELFAQELRGDKVYTIGDVEVQFERKKAERDAEFLAAEAEKLGSGLPKEVQIEAVDLAIELAAAKNWTTMSKEEQDAEIESAFALPVPASATTGEEAAAPVVGQERPAAELTTQSEAELAAKVERENDQKAAERARIKRESEVAPGAFQLQPQTKPAKIAEAEGAAKTGDIFSQPANTLSAADLLRAAASKMDEAAKLAEPAAKEPWQMTKEEWLDRPAGSVDVVRGVGGAERLRIIEARHKVAVERALAAGKPVPAEVLADYPDLNPEQQPPARVAEKPEPHPQSEIPETAQLDDRWEGDRGAIPGEPYFILDATDENPDGKAYLTETEVPGKGALWTAMIADGATKDFSSLKEAASWAESQAPALSESGDRGVAPTREGGLPEVGVMVKLKIPGPSGPMNVAGRVTRIMPDGLVEVKTQQHGYRTVDASKLTIVAPTREGGLPEVIDRMRPYIGMRGDLYALAGDGKRDLRRELATLILGRPSKSGDLTLKAMTAALVNRLGGNASTMAGVEQEQFIADKFEGGPAGVEQPKPAYTASVKVDANNLSRGILGRMDIRLKSLGYDSRGSDDVRTMLKTRIAPDGIITHPDWIAAYEAAVKGAQATRERLDARTAVREKATNVDFARIRELGLTENWSEAGYITPSGSLIDLSGKREGGERNTRALDHREVGGSKGMQEFMALGNIRTDFNSGTMDISMEPTQQQHRRIAEFADAKNGELVVDLEQGLGEERESYYSQPERRFSREYPVGTKPARIAADIRRFFAGEQPLELRQPKPEYDPTQLDLIYDHIETRPDTTREQKALGVSAVRALFGGDRKAGATLLGSALWKNIEEHGGSELIGLQAGSAIELAIPAQILRTPYWEIMRVFFTLKGVIVDHTAWTMRQPGAVDFSIGKGNTEAGFDARIAELTARMKASGADGYKLMHNHPGGFAVPSEADEAITIKIAKAMPGFQGHIVINHNQYAEINAAGESRVSPLPERARTGPAEPELAHDVLGMNVTSPMQLVRAGSMLSDGRKGYGVLIATNAPGNIQALAEVPETQLLGATGYQKLKAMARIRRFMERTGSSGGAFLVAENPSRFDWLLERGALTDAMAPWETASTSSPIVTRADTGIGGRSLNFGRRSTGALAANQITWHGSPYTFKPTEKNPLGEFDPSKVGTGERAGVGTAPESEADRLEQAATPYTVQSPLSSIQRSSRVSNFVDGLTSSPSPLGIFNGLNTQYHKAKMLARQGIPQFLHVFERMQHYLNDIAGIAAQSEQLAPQLFRELKGITPKDFRKYFKAAASEADIAAIGPWLNHGTLYGNSPMEGVIWTNDELRGKATKERPLPRIAPLTEEQIPLYHQAVGWNKTDRELPKRYTLGAIGQSLESSAKAVIYRHVNKYGIEFDRDMSLADVAETVRNQLSDKVDELQMAVDEAIERTDEAFVESDRTGQIADADRRNREARIAADNAKAVYTKTQARLDKLQADMATLQSLLGDRPKIAEKKLDLAGEVPQRTPEQPENLGTITEIEKHAKELIDHGYMPLKRFGQKTVTAFDKDGNTRFFGAYDGTPLVPGSANSEMLRVAEEVKALHPDWRVVTGTRPERAWKMYQGLSLDALENFLDFLDPETKAELERDKTIQEYLKNAVNNNSVLKQLIHRKGTPGFSTDVPRILASFITSSARNASGLYHIAEAKRLVSEIPKEYGVVADEAADMVDYVTKPGEEAAKLRSFLFFNYLGGSIAAAAINLTQTVMTTVPFLSQYANIGKLTASILSASKLAVGDPALMEGALGKALQRAERDGVTAPQQIYHLTAMAANNPFSADRRFRTAMAVWNGMFGAAEVFNRRVAFIAAHEIYGGMTPEARTDTGFDTAYDFAKDAVDETQFIYNRGSRPNLGRGAIGATLITFKTFSIAYLELLRRLPPKQQLMMLGVLMLMAGAEGVPFAEDIEDMVDTLGQWLGFTTNTGKWTGRKIRDTLGHEFERPILKGLGGMLPIDLHSRLGMHNLLPGTPFFKPSEIDKTRDAFDALGPFGGVLQSLSQALQLMARGKWDQAAVMVAPKAARDAYNGAYIAATGESQDTKGRLAMKDMTLGEGFGKAIGFNPQRAAAESEIKRELQLDKNLRTVRMDDIASDWADGILRSDQDKVKDARERYLEWNKNNPELRIDGMQMRRSVSERVKAGRMTSEQRYLKSVPKALKPEARELFK